MAGDGFLDLDARSRAFIEEAIASGRYRSPSEVISAGLRLLQNREASVVALRQELINGERSGTAVPFDEEQFIARKRAAGPSDDAR